MRPDARASTLTRSPDMASSRARDTILFLTEDSKPALGGIAEYLHNLAVELSTRFDVLVLTSVEGAEQLNDALPYRFEEVKWFRSQCPMRGDGITLLRKLNTLRWRWGHQRSVRAVLQRVLNGKRVRLVFVGRLSPVTHNWCVACRVLDIPYRVFAHGLEFVERTTAPKAWGRRRDIAGGAWFHPNSRYTAALIEGLGVPRERITLTVPGVRAEDHPTPARDMIAATRARWRLEGRRFLFSICRLGFRKGIDLAIEAFAEISREHPDLDFVVAGIGPELQHLMVTATRHGIADRVHFVHDVDDKTKHVFFAECELFIMPNRQLPDDVEGFGIVFLEAALYAKPSIGGNNGGVPDAVENGVTGLLVDTSTSSAPVVAALRRLLDDPALARRLGEAGRTRALERFAWPVIARPLIEAALSTPPLSISGARQ